MRTLFPVTLALLAASSTWGPSAARGAQATNDPGIVSGWPVLLRGGVTGAPVAADVDGDGALEIVAPAMHRGGYWGEASHPEPVRAPQLWAARLDGTVVGGWPVTLQTAESRDPTIKPEPGLTGNWYSSPSVCDANGDGADEVVIGLPHSKQRQVVVVYGDGGVVAVSPGGEPWASVPARDVDGDGTPDLLGHDTITNALGRPIKDWPHEKRPQMVYQPAIADMNGDGEVEVFVGTFQNDWHLPGMPVANRLEGLDRKGNRLPGWPQQMTTIATYVSIGDVWGDAKKEVIAVDLSGNLHVWGLDGKPAAPGSGADAADASIVKKNVSAGYAPPCLADLDGDGKAEILLLERGQGALHALRGDGKPFFKPRAAPLQTEPTPEQIEAAIKALPKVMRRDPTSKAERALDPANPDDRRWLELRARLRLMRRPPAGAEGALAMVPPDETGTFSGVVAADLGGDGVMDVFAGTTWLQIARDGTVKTIPMLSEGDRGQARNNTSCSIVDVAGSAHVTFGLSDGRLFLFRTGKAYKKEHAHWISSGGDFGHTGVWERR